MKIALAQLSPVVGDCRGNFEIIKNAYLLAEKAGASLCVTPELAVTGYPPHDLLENVDLLRLAEESLGKLQALTQGKTCALAVGSVRKNSKPHGCGLHNSVCVLQGGKLVFEQAKSLLPTYDVFDESRYFEPASQRQVWNGLGAPIAFAICEDLWGGDQPALYEIDPVTDYQKQNAALVISLSASPYQAAKDRRRRELHAEVAKKLKAPVLYVNQLCANDEILFDGGAFALDASGKTLGQSKRFEGRGETLFLANVDLETRKIELDPATEVESLSESENAELDVLTRGLELGIRHYFERSGFSKAVIGLSGGIDSAVVAALAVNALGKKNVLGVAMPAQHSSGHSLEDAEELARALGISFEVRPIKFLVSAMTRELQFGVVGQTLGPLASENLQARFRGLTLMALSNHLGALVLTTGNKSEIAMGYCTLYGDMCGALAPIGDLYKTQVYALARRLSPPIPGRSLTKPPSAELRPNQTDQDTLPPYPLLDRLLADYLEEGLSEESLEQTYSKELRKHGHEVRAILRTVEQNEYKRRQAAPVLRVSSKAFGLGRRMPIAKVWL